MRKDPTATGPLPPGRGRQLGDDSKRGEPVGEHKPRTGNAGSGVSLCKRGCDLDDRLARVGQSTDM